MRILVLNYEYPPVGGGGGMVCQQVSEGLARRGHEVVVLTVRHGTLPSTEILGNLTVRRISALRRRRDRSGVLEMAAYVIGATIVGYRLARRFKPDVIHGHFAVPTGAAVWAIAQSLRIPYVITAHLGDVPGGVPQQTDRLFRLVFPFTKPIWRDASDTTAVSSFVARLAITAYGREPRLIFNGIDVESIPMPAIEQRSDMPRLMWVGRMQTQKNLLFGLRALALLPNLPWRLDLIGDGPQRKEAEELSGKLGLSNRIRFHGWLPNEDVQRLMERSNILFMPSLSEGMPMVAVEALAHGLGIICSRIDGLADVAREGLNAYLCPLHDPESYANALRDLCQHPDRLRKFQHASRQLARAFDLPRIIAQYEQTLRVAAGGGD